MKVLILIVASILVAGCAIAPEAGEPREQKSYRTGSNIPVRDDSSTAAKSGTVQPGQLPPNTARSPNQSGG
jgi:hypothetical protein